MLKIEVPRAELKSALQTVAIGIEGGEDDKLTTHYTFRVTDGKVEMLAAGPRVFASYQLEGTKCSADTGSFTVPGWRLKGWVDVVTDDTLSLEHENAVTRLVSTKGSGKVQSLDASQFPYWDSTLAGASLTATVDPKPFLTGMDYAKRFTSDQDTKNPTLVLVECRNGMLHATDTLAFSLVEVPGLTNLKIRVNNKDVSSVNAFMGLVGDGNKVEILETEKCQFFRSGNRLLGVSRWMYEFPALNMNRDEPNKASVTVKAADLKSALSYVEKFAKKLDRTAYFSFTEDALGGGTSLNVSAASAANSDERDSVAVSVSASVGLDAFTAAGYTEFRLSRDYLDKVLSAWDATEDITLGLGWTKKNGFARFRRVKDGNDYFTVVVWSK